MRLAAANGSCICEMECFGGKFRRDRLNKFTAVRPPLTSLTL